MARAMANVRNVTVAAKNTNMDAKNTAALMKNMLLPRLKTK